MLKITIKADESFNEETSEFVQTEDSVELELEHSLASLSSWESKWEKPFLTEKEKTDEEALDYVRCMCLTPDIPPEVFYRLSNSDMLAINEYITAKMTATWFTEMPGQPKRHEIITAELVYYWMVSLNIPFEAQYWHFNRLITLIQVCDRKNAPAKKMPKQDALAQRRKLNEQRRRAAGSTG